MHRQPWTQPSPAIPRGGIRTGMLVLLAFGGLSACSDILDVEAPSQVVKEDLERPSNAQILVNGVIADFECAFGQYIVVGGLVGEEFHDASINSQWWHYDRRSFSPSGSIYATAGCTGGGIYTPLQTARFQAENTLRLLEGWSDAEVANRTKLIATAAAYAGYSYVLLGESMCSAAVNGGPEVGREDLFRLAEERFAQAISAAQEADATDILNLARVGRARARLNLGKLAEAAADARPVPNGFVWEATFSSNEPIRENQVYTANWRAQQVTVDEAYRNLTFQGVPDPRIPVVDASGTRGPDEETPMYYQNKYSSPGDPIPLATWQEAQLIIAEAELAAGNLQAAVGIINQLHDQVNLPRFSSTDARQIMDQLIYERRAELFLESHHLGDLIRYRLPLEPAAGTPYQAQKGGVYGGQLCFPLPDVERLNNPNIPDT